MITHFFPNFPSFLRFIFLSKFEHKLVIPLMKNETIQRKSGVIWEALFEGRRSMEEEECGEARSREIGKLEAPVEPLMNRANKRGRR